jgi:flagellar biosynthetic protein FlhB
MAHEDSDRSEKATPHKLEKARREGSVARSADLTAVGVLAAMVVTLLAGGWKAMEQTASLMQLVFSRAGTAEWSADSMMAWVGQLAIAALQILSPLFLAVVIAAVLVNMLQSGPVFSARPLAPDLDRINPAKGFKRFFSLRILYETAKSVFKLVLLGAVVYTVIRAAVPGMLALSTLDAKAYGKILIDLCGSILVKLVFVLLALALLDLIHARHEFAKRMRMSKRDVRNEVKNREGDPRVRSRIRSLRKEVLKRSRATRNLPSADVLITNPTHLAVALRYRHGQTGAPQLVAKGAGELAGKMREVAARHGIPVVQNRALARVLFREVECDSAVPEKLFPQLARILVWVYTMREARQRKQELVA